MSSVKPNLNGSRLAIFYLPARIHVQRTDEFHVAGQHLRGILKQTLVFHWFSINEDPNPDLFKDSVVSKEESILQLLDPVKTKATEILELYPLEKEDKETGGTAKRKKPNGKQSK